MRAAWIVVSAAAWQCDFKERGPYTVGMRDLHASVATRNMTVMYPAVPKTGGTAEDVRVDLNTMVPGDYKDFVYQVMKPEDLVVTAESIGYSQMASNPDVLPEPSGRGWPVVFYLHGWPSSRWSSFNLQEHWASRGFVVVAADAPGFHSRDVEWGHTSRGTSAQIEDVLQIVRMMESASAGEAKAAAEEAAKATAEKEAATERTAAERTATTERVAEEAAAEAAAAKAAEAAAAGAAFSFLAQEVDVTRIALVGSSGGARALLSLEEGQLPGVQLLMPLAYVSTWSGVHRRESFTDVWQTNLAAAPFVQYVWGLKDDRAPIVKDTPYYPDGPTRMYDATVPEILADSKGNTSRAFFYPGVGHAGLTLLCTVWKQLPPALAAGLGFLEQEALFQENCPPCVSARERMIGFVQSITAAALAEALEGSECATDALARIPDCYEEAPVATCSGTGDAMQCGWARESAEPWVTPTQCSTDCLAEEELTECHDPVACVRGVDSAAGPLGVALWALLQAWRS